MNLCRYTTGILGLALLCFAFGQQAHASTVTENGTFSADNDVYEYDFSLATPQSFTFQTTSYANGGFVPVLTLFSADGPVIGSDGADGVCNGSETPDSTTGICDDAFLQETLSSGSYVLDLTEFPNEAINGLSDGFLFASDPTATGDVCSVPGGMFLQSDLASCVQRTADYSVTIAPTPEPSTFLLCLPIAGLVIVFSRRRLA